MIIRVKDADEKLFELDDAPEKEESEGKEEKGDNLSAAEIKVLKKLAAKAKDLLALVSDEDEEDAEKETAKKAAKPDDYLDVETEKEEDEDGKEIAENDEEIVEDSCYRCGDSAKSINSIEKKKVADSATVVDHEEEVNDAWAKFYANQL